MFHAFRFSLFVSKVYLILIQLVSSRGVDNITAVFNLRRMNGYNISVVGRRASE